MDDVVQLQAPDKSDPNTNDECDYEHNKDADQDTHPVCDDGYGVGTRKQTSTAGSGPVPIMVASSELSPRQMWCGTIRLYQELDRRLHTFH